MSAAVVHLDRTLRVPAGHRVDTGWVDASRVHMDCVVPMAVGDVAHALQKVLCNGDDACWPPPTGYWKGDTFHLQDGRHEYVARLMRGRRKLFVAWLRREDDGDISLPGDGA